MDDEMKRELAAVKADTDTLKTDVSTLKGDVSGLKMDVRRVMAALVRIEGKMDDFSERLDQKPDRSEMNAKFDASAKRLAEIDFRLAVHIDWIQGHDKRISKLEARRS